LNFQCVRLTPNPFLRHCYKLPEPLHDLFTFKVLISVLQFPMSILTRTQKCTSVKTCSYGVCQWCPDTLDLRHFGPKTFRHHRSVTLIYLF